MTITLDGLLLYCGALVILFLTPGPVWVALIARGLTGGFSGAWPLAVGVAIGDMVWPLAASFGLSWMVSVYAGFMDAMRWVAVAIFLLMGWLLIRHADRPISQDSRLTRPAAGQASPPVLPPSWATRRPSCSTWASCPGSSICAPSPAWMSPRSLPSRSPFR